MERFDDAVVGAGIIGLATAYHLARRGRRVLVVERNARACGASVRNFGMLWPIGQPAGPLRDLARRSRTLWSEVLADAGLWHDPGGSLHLAYHDDEAAVLREFLAAERAAGARPDTELALLSPAEVRERAPAVLTDGLRTALWSASEACVDPREVIAALPSYLERRYGVRFVFGSTANAYTAPLLTAGGRDWQAGRLFVCSGDDLATLFPETLASAGLILCKLQMMRTRPQPDSWRLGPMLAGGLTLRHYAAFRNCPTLPALHSRVTRENPEFDRFGIHVMASQNGAGEIVLGDSHEYGDAEALSPFNREEIDTLILGYLATFLRLPEPGIAARWNGVYVKHPTEPWVVLRPVPDVTCIVGLGGAGMTFSFGLTERVVTEELGKAE